MASNPVGDLLRAAFKKEFPELFSGEAQAKTRLFQLPTSECTRVPAPGAEPSNADRLELSSAFESALFRLYAEFGLPLRAPLTYGELMGAYSYCEVLYEDSSYPKINPKDDAIWQQAADTTLARHTPELIASVHAYRAGNRAELERIGREVLNPQVLSWHYVESYGGWAGEPYLKENGIEMPVLTDDEAKKDQPRLRLVK